MSLGHWILVISIYPVILIMYVILKNEGYDSQKGIYYGVTIRKEHAKDPALKAIEDIYKRQIKRFLWIGLWTSIPVLLIPPFSLSFCYWSVWFVFVLIMYFIPFVTAHKKLKELKVEKGWIIGEVPTRYAEMKEASRIRKVKWYDFLAPILISGACVIWAVLRSETDIAVLLIIMASTLGGTTLMFAGMAFWMDKEKTIIISSDSNVNVNYTRARKNMWKNFWVGMAWFNTLYTVGILFYLMQETEITGMFWLLLGIYILTSIVLFVRVIKKSKALEERYADKMDLKIEEDDANWIWGIFYYNPKDKHTMVNMRVGIGTTANFATPIGKGIALIGILSILMMPILSIWLILDEFTPIQLVVAKDCVVAKHVTEKYRIPLEEVKEVKLLTQLPKISRNYGTSMNHLKKGKYRFKEESVSGEVLLNPQNGLFIRLETEEEIYLFSGFDDEETRQVYEEMRK